MRRRAVTLVAAVLAAMVTLTACGSTSGKSDSSTNSARSGSASTAGYPVTVDTAWGKITLDKKPERIVVLGPNYVDILSSLGQKPVAFYPGNGTTTSESDLLEKMAWLKGKFSSDQIDTSLFSGSQASAEAVAALHPDLILGSIWSIPQKQYAQFSQIAPTYVGRSKTAQTDWTDILTDVGALTGESSKAKSTIASVDATFAAAKKKLPGLQGKSYLEAYDLNNQFYLNALTWAPKLGLVPDPRLNPGLSKNSKPVSLENIGQLDSDVLFVVSGFTGTGSSVDKLQKQLEADPNFTALPASKSESVFYLTSQIATAQLSDPGPSSMTWLLGQVLPELEKSPLNKQ